MFLQTKCIHTPTPNPIGFGGPGESNPIGSGASNPIGFGGAGVGGAGSGGAGSGGAGVGGSGTVGPNTISTITSNLSVTCEVPLNHKQFAGILRAMGVQLTDPVLNPNRRVVAIDSNHFHAWVPDYKSLRKTRAEAAARGDVRVGAGNKIRKRDGDGSGFDSCIDIHVDGAEFKKGLATTYNIKHFPANNSLQVTGGRHLNLCDAYSVAGEWLRIVYYVIGCAKILASRGFNFANLHPDNTLDIRNALEAASPYDPTIFSNQVRVVSATIENINFKFVAITGEACLFQDRLLQALAPLKERYPQCNISHISKSTELQLLFLFEGREVRLKIFLKQGKCNIMGCKSAEQGEFVHFFCNELIHSYCASRAATSVESLRSSLAKILMADDLGDVL